MGNPLQSLRTARLATIFLLIATAAAWCEDTRQTEYSPLLKTDSRKVAFEDLTLHDPVRNREIPLRIYREATVKSAPVILFSHGLGGSREMGTYLGEHWAARGYVVVFLQHPGSDTSVWKGKRPAQIMAAMKEAANAENFLLRIQDVSAVIDQLTDWTADATHPLHGTIDIDKVGMSGHSFGAITTQSVSGQGTSIGVSIARESRIKAALPMSPSSPPISDPERAFTQVQIPWLLMTGTEDVSPIGGQTVESRRAVYAALPPGNKYELVLHGGKHSAFTDRALPREQQSRNPNHHRVILAISTAFWDAYLKGDILAKAWLDGRGPAQVLEPEDQWQHK